MTGVRIDKWLWAARFFKTRSTAEKACELGRVESNGIHAKPAREVKVGDTIRVKTEGGTFTVEVLGLSEMRGPAPVAQTLYRETDESKEARRREAEARRLEPSFEGYRDGGRPSKKDRRALGRLKGRG